MRRIKHSHRKITMTHIQTSCPNCIVFRAGKNGPRPAEVGALAPVLEKSAAELKQKPKLLKCKSTIQRVTFSVRNLNRIGQLLELSESGIDHNIDIVCIQEHWCLHSEDIKYHDTGTGWTFVSASAWKTVNATIGSLGMLIGPRVGLC